MKRLTLSLALFSVGLGLLAASADRMNARVIAAVPVQAEAADAVAPSTDDEAIDNAKAEVPAAYPGGEVALFTFIMKNLSYPEAAKEMNQEGTVLLRFMVNADGTVGKIKLEKSLSKECDAAAANVVRKLARFEPAKQNGRAVPVWITLPIQFRMN